MKKTAQKLAIAMIIIAIAIGTSSFKSDIGKVVADFKLRNVNGKMLATTDYKNAKGFIVIFTCNHCPFAKLYTKRLNELNTKYTALGVPLIAVNSMDTLVYKDESYNKMQEKAKKDAYNFPYLLDAMQAVGKNFGAGHTPAAYVIWKEGNQWKIKYSGAIDDNGEKPAIANPFVANAVDELLQGKTVSKPETESFGCRILYR